VTSVYIGNATKQVLQFAYRVAERRGPIVQTIERLSQEKLSWDMTPHDIDRLLEHCAMYGFVNVSEMEQVKGDFEGYVISVGRPIPSTKLVNAYEKRQTMLEERGKVIREQAAVVIDEMVSAESHMPPNTFEISVAEIEPERGFENPEAKHIAEGFRIQRGPSAPPPDPKRVKRRVA
jgi:hypothetical protein